MSTSYVFPVGNEFKENPNLLSARKSVKSDKKFGVQSTRKPLADKSNTVHTPSNGGNFSKGLQKPVKKIAVDTSEKNSQYNKFPQDLEYLLDTCSGNLKTEDTYPGFMLWETVSKTDIENIVRWNVPTPSPAFEPEKIVEVPAFCWNDLYDSELELQPLPLDYVDFPMSY